MFVSKQLNQYLFITIFHVILTKYYSLKYFLLLFYLTWYTYLTKQLSLSTPYVLYTYNAFTWYTPITPLRPIVVYTYNAFTSYTPITPLRPIHL